MNASILTVGDELLIGQVVNTNASVISKKLNSIGIEVIKMETVGDDETEMLSSVDSHFKRFDLTIVTGGLGPTHDDITKTVLCRYFKTKLVRSEEVIEDINRLMERRNFKWNAANETQALVPETAQIIHNQNGTAPGLLFEENGHFLIAMPGVPFEMEGMMNDFVLPYFQPKATGSVILHRTLNTTGIAESALFEKLGNLDEILNGIKLAFLPSQFGTRLRLTLVHENLNEAEHLIAQAEKRIREKAEEYIFGVEDETLAQAIGKLLTERNLTLATAESCTGGYLANQVTNISGSSSYFMRGVVTYSNESKTELLGVPKELIAQYGAVSREVAEAMATGIRKTAGTDFGISTTGIAGPTGGTPEKPVGLVFVGFADQESTLALKFNFGDNRLRFKERAAQAALNILRKKILSLE